MSLFASASLCDVQTSLYGVDRCLYTSIIDQPSIRTVLGDDDAIAMT